MEGILQKNPGAIQKRYVHLHATQAKNSLKKCQRTIEKVEKIFATHTKGLYNSAKMPANNPLEN